MQLRQPELSTYDELNHSNTNFKYVIYFEDLEGFQNGNIPPVLGKGCHSTVYNGGKYSSNEVAVKKVFPGSGYYPSESKISQLLQDAITRDNTGQHHIVPYYGYAINRGYDYLVYALMYCTLEEWIVLKNNYSNIGLNYRLMGHVAEALTFLHRFAIHCDIKPDNIFISKKGFYTEAFLGDFSLSFLKKVNYRHPVPAGAILYRAPELLRREEGITNNEATDIYSLGLVYYFVATSVMPYHDFNDKRLFTQAVGYRLLPLYTNEKAEQNHPKLLAMSDWCTLTSTRRPTAQQLVDEFATPKNVLSKNLSIFTRTYRAEKISKVSRQRTRTLLPGCLM